MLLELYRPEYWDYIAVAVLSNRPQNIYLDRPANKKKHKSILLEVSPKPLVKNSGYQDEKTILSPEADFDQIEWRPEFLRGVLPVNYTGEGLHNTFKRNEIRFVVVRSQPVKHRLNGLSYVKLVEEVGRYGIYRVDL